MLNIQYHWFSIWNYISVSITTIIFRKDIQGTQNSDALNPKRQKIFRKECMKQENYCLVGEMFDVRTKWMGRWYANYPTLFSPCRLKTKQNIQILATFLPVWYLNRMLGRCPRRQYFIFKTISHLQLSNQLKSTFLKSSNYASKFEKDYIWY